MLLSPFSILRHLSLRMPPALFIPPRMFPAIAPSAPRSRAAVCTAADSPAAASPASTDPAPVPASTPAPANPVPAPAAEASFTDRPRSQTRCRDTVKRKVALLVAYEGSRYHGLQRNRGVQTVSDALEGALHAAGAIADSNVGALEKIQWQVAARTDRGVSAAGNLVSAKLLFRRDELAAGHGLAHAATVERVNALLPSHVRLLAVRAVTGSFSARSSCDARWYEYLLPVRALGLEDSADDAGVDAVREGVAQLDDLLQAYVGSHYFHNFTVGADHSVPPRDQARRVITHMSAEVSSVLSSARPIPTEGETEASETTEKTSTSAVAEAAATAATATEESPDAATSTKPSDWVRVRVQGQSFMLHQIRKMVALAVLTYRGDVPADAIPRALGRDVLVNIPPAPALGLFLDAVHFGWYNERHANVLAEPLTLAAVEADREKFKHEEIFPVVARLYNTGDDLDVFFETAKAHPVRFD